MATMNHHYIKSLLASLLLLLAPATVSDTGKPDRVESFFWQPQDLLVVTHNGGAFLKTTPEGVPLLNEPGLQNGLAVLVKLRNKEGEVIGFASELEVFPKQGAVFNSGDALIWDTVWTLTIPGRGSLFLYEKEHEVEKVTAEVMAPTFETGKPWEGEMEFQSTYGPLPDRYGTVIGGTGEFTGAGGRFLEFGRITRFTAEGEMHLFGELRIFLSYDN